MIEIRAAFSSVNARFVQLTKEDERDEITVKMFDEIQKPLDMVIPGTRFDQLQLQC